MKIELTSKATRGDIALFAYEGASAPLGLTPAQGKALMALAAEDGFSGKDKELVVIRPGAPGEIAGTVPQRVFLVGLGPKKSFTAETLRQRIAALVKHAGSLKKTGLDLLLPGPKDIRFGTDVAVQAVTEAAQLVSYQFLKYKAAPKEPTKELEILTIVLPERRLLNDKLKRLVADTEAACAGVRYSRNLTNEPANVKTPEQIGEWARELAVPGRITVKVHHKPEIEKMGMGGLLSVAAGSDQPPVFLHLSYEPKAAKKTIVLVGKGLTFDSGGLNIKTGTFMNNMKDDMSGGAAVLGFFHALRTVNLPVKVHGLVPLTENMSGGKAMKVGDVLKAHNGKTIEVLNTDAEGRLILADALAFGAALKPDLMIDMATLTGACVVALGPQVTGALGTAQKVIDKLIELGKSTGESFWQLPLYESYREWGKSKVADINNIGKPGQGGTIFAGLFLQEFVGDTPWVHMDIAGTALTEDEKGYLTAGGTGVPIRTLFALLKGF